MAPKQGPRNAIGILRSAFAALARWLLGRRRSTLATGSYDVRAFRAEGVVADHLAPLARDGVVRLCFKPPADPRDAAAAVR